MPAEFEIAGRKIGTKYPPYVVAEISGNHNGSIERAMELIGRASDAGAHAVKLQTYTADTMTLRHEGPGFKIDAGPWQGRYLHDLYEEAHTPWEWHAPLFARARELGVAIFSTPFDLTAIQFLEQIGTPAYKIASPEIVDLPLIRAVARTNKPMVISTGMANREEIAEAVGYARSCGATQIAVLHCVSGYPSLPSESNLSMIRHISEMLGVVSGLSDHSLGTGVAVAAAALGASIIEKHIVLDREEGGPDAHFSLEPEDFRVLCTQVREGWEAIGGITYELQPSEKVHLDYRRSLYVVADVRAGEPFTAQNVRAIRPGFGLAPKFYDQVIGSVAAIDLARGTPLKAEHLRAAGGRRGS